MVKVDLGAVFVVDSDSVDAESVKSEGDVDVSSIVVFVCGFDVEIAVFDESIVDTLLVDGSVVSMPVVDS